MRIYSDHIHLLFHFTFYVNINEKNIILRTLSLYVYDILNEYNININVSGLQSYALMNIMEKYPIRCRICNDKKILYNKNVKIDYKMFMNNLNLKKICEVLEFKIDRRRIKNKIDEDNELYTYYLREITSFDYDNHINKEDKYKKKLKKYIKKLFKPQVLPFKKELLYKLRMKKKLKILS